MENSETKTFFQSTTAKMIMVGLLSLALLIPLFFVQDLIQERSQRKKEMVNEVADLWGKDIVFYGPILKVPYTFVENYNITDVKTSAVSIQKTERETIAIRILILLANIPIAILYFFIVIKFNL